MADPCFISGISLLCVASMCSILALSLDYWETGDIDYDSLGPIRIHYITMRAGLWNEYRTFHRSSIFSEINNNVSDIVEGKEYTIEREINYHTNGGIFLLIARLLLFLASFSLVGAVVCIILKTKVYKSMDCLMNVAWIFSSEAGVLLLISFVVYMKGIKTKSTDFHAAFYLDIIGWILAWAAAGLLFMSSRTFSTLVND